MSDKHNNQDSQYDQDFRRARYEKLMGNKPNRYRARPEEEEKEEDDLAPLSEEPEEESAPKKKRKRDKKTVDPAVLAARQENMKKLKRYSASLGNAILLHFSTLFFVAILIYMVVSLTHFKNRETPGVYTVIPGDNGYSTLYEGVIIRAEENAYAPDDGYLTYYIGEGSRARISTTICSLDEKGDFIKQLVSQADLTNDLSDDALTELKSQLMSLGRSADRNEFTNVYDRKYELCTNLVSLLTDTIKDRVAGATDEYTFRGVKASTPGVIMQRYDGFEGLTVEDVTMELFANRQNTETRLYSGAHVNRGDIMFKTLVNDSFSIVFPITEEDSVKYWENQKITAYFPGLDKSMTGKFSFHVTGEGDRRNYFGVVSYENSGYLFAKKRFVKLQLAESYQEGLKVPQTALTQKTYYALPKDYLTNGGTSSTKNKLVIYRGANEYGIVQAEIRELSDYLIWNGTLLVGKDELAEGTILLKPEAQDRMVVGETLTLEGVYNLNKGYAAFRPVVKICDLGDYCLIRENITGSVGRYDHIAIRADKTYDNMLLY